MSFLENNKQCGELPSGHYIDTTESEKEALKASSRTHDYPFAIRYAFDASALQFIFKHWDDMTQVAMAEHFGIPMNSFKSVTLKKRREYGDDWQRLWMEEVLTQSLELTDKDGGVKALYLIRDGSAPILMDARDTTDENGNRLYANKKAGSGGKKWKESKREHIEIRDGIKCTVNCDDEVVKVHEPSGNKSKDKKAAKLMNETANIISDMNQTNSTPHNSLFSSSQSLTEELSNDSEIDKERHRQLRLKMIGSNIDTVPILAARHYWPVIKAQFNKEEVRYFEEEWYALMAQFAVHGIAYTDEGLMTDLITHNIMINRVLTKRQQMSNQAEELERLIMEEEANGEDADPVLMSTYRQHHASLLAGVEGYSNEYLKLQQGKEKYLKNLKATRDQRLSQIEDAKADFFSKIELLDEIQNREAEGKRLALIRKSVEAEQERLGSLHEFGDGDVDKPFLNADTILNDGADTILKDDEE